jgi:hypothetical protein
MNYIRYIPIICIIGAAVGVFALTQLWIHETAGYVWTKDLTGLDLMNSSLDGFQKYVPLIVCVISVIAAGLAVATMTVRGFWYGIFICMIMGVLLMVATTTFSSWEVAGEKMVHFVDIGFWLSYVAGGLIIVGAAVQYTLLFRKPAKRH